MILGHRRVQESHKREAQVHYKGGRGYQPAVMYWVEQDLVVADEYRDGNVPAGMDNLPLIQRGFASLLATVTDYYWRSGPPGRRQHKPCLGIRVLSDPLTAPPYECMREGYWGVRECGDVPTLLARGWHSKAL
jgi:hypothetical protein